MSIFVGIWSRDTETKLSENQGSRLYLLEKAVAATEAKRRAVAHEHDFGGSIESIFVAPEYLFSAERTDPTAARSISLITCEAIKSILQDTSRSYPKMLIVPGSIIYKQDLEQFPILGEKKRLKALEHIRAAQTPNSGSSIAGTSALKNPQKIEILEKVATLTKEEKNKLLVQGVTTSLIKNRVFVFLNGAVAFSYGKKGDMQEAIGSDALGGVFVPGRKAGLKDIAGINFGFEICWDHEISALKTTIGNGPKPDIQIVCSAHVDNRKENMVVRPGGFAIHASSKADKSGIHYMKPGGPPRTVGKLVIKQIPKAIPSEEAMGSVIHLGTEEIAGSPLSYYVINYTAV